MPSGKNSPGILRNCLEENEDCGGKRTPGRGNHEYKDYEAVGGMTVFGGENVDNVLRRRGHKERM